MSNFLVLYSMMESGLRMVEAVEFHLASVWSSRSSGEAAGTSVSSSWARDALLSPTQSVSSMMEW